MLSIGWAVARWRRARPRSLLDNAPLEGLLVPVERLPRMMAEGHLQALAITASSYGSGLHVTSYGAMTRAATSCRGRARSASRVSERWP